jgi:hypothetical protein
MLHTFLMKRIILAIAAVAMAGGVASADRWHGGRGGNHRGNDHRVVEHSHREGGVRVTPTYRGHYNSGHYNSGYRYHANYARRPIYVQRPVIRTHYYDVRYRPQVIVENYPARDGYYWVAGQWNWNGYEWLWTPGHYEPIAADYYYPGY